MKKLILLLLALIAIGAIVTWALPRATHPPVSGTPDQSGSVPATTTSVTTTIMGTFVCLPHKGSGPSTMECAYGMKGEDGAYYALDWSGTSVSASDLPMQRKYSVTGLFVPVEALNSDHWQVYDIKGVIKVSSYQEDSSDIPVMPMGSPATLELKKPVRFATTTVTVAAVTEDSRCPSDVTCIQAGRVRAALTIASPLGTAKTLEIQPGQTVTTETLEISLVKVIPYPVSTHKIADDEYRFVFTVKAK